MPRIELCEGMDLGHDFDAGCPRISIALSCIPARQAQSRRRDNRILPRSPPSESCYDPQLSSRMALRRFVYFFYLLRHKKNSAATGVYSARLRLPASQRTRLRVTLLRGLL